MECIIDAIIRYQDKMVNNIAINRDSDVEKCKQSTFKQSDNEVVCTTNKLPLTLTNNTSVNCSLSFDLKALLHDNSEQVCTDHNIYFPNKSHGHLTIKADPFQFIGPDRRPVEVDNIHEYLSMVKLSRVLGFLITN